MLAPSGGRCVKVESTVQSVILKSRKLSYKLTWPLTENQCYMIYHVSTIKRQWYMCGYNYRISVMCRTSVSEPIINSRPLVTLSNKKRASMSF